MSRSRKKIPISGIAGDSDKIGKRIANRKFRCRERTMMSSNRMNQLPFKMNEVYNVWSMPKDGKFYFGDWKFDNDQEIKDQYEKLLRK